jgi:phenylalanyl-tRNA synthetase beta chain
MNLSMRWLKEFVPIDEMPIRDFTEAVTMSGSKVESWEREGAEITNVVVGKIVSLERHPDSDHLWITKTDVGAEEAAADRHRRAESESRRHCAGRAA